MPTVGDIKIRKGQSMASRSSQCLVTQTHLNSTVVRVLEDRALCKGQRWPKGTMTGSEQEFLESFGASGLR